MRCKLSMLGTILAVILFMIAVPNGFAISSEPVYNESGEQTQQSGSGQSGNPLAISSEPVYRGGPNVQAGSGQSGNPLAISSEPVYRGGPNVQAGSGQSGNPLAISSEPVYRGGGAPQNIPNASRRRTQGGR